MYVSRVELYDMSCSMNVTIKIWEDEPDEQTLQKVSQLAGWKDSVDLSRSYRMW